MIWRQVITSIFIITLLTPNFYAIVAGRESWPYTNAPMFAHYVHAQSPRYRFVFEGHFSNGAIEELGYYSIAAEWGLMRYFFKYVYGAAQENSVHNAISDDTPEKFSTRLSEFFFTFVNEYNSQQRFVPAAIERINLYVAKLDQNNKDKTRKRVGIYSHNKRIFKHTRDNEL